MGDPTVQGNALIAACFYQIKAWGKPEPLSTLMNCHLYDLVLDSGQKTSAKLTQTFIDGNTASDRALD